MEKRGEMLNVIMILRHCLYKIFFSPQESFSGKQWSVEWNSLVLRLRSDSGYILTSYATLDQLIHTLNCSIQNGLHDTTDNYGTRVSQMQ